MNYTVRVYSFERRGIDKIFLGYVSKKRTFAKVYSGEAFKNFGKGVSHMSNFRLYYLFFIEVDFRESHPNRRSVVT